MDSLWNLHLTISYTVSQGWGLINRVCRSSLVRGTQGPPALAGESDRRCASELVCGGTVPGKLAHRCPPWRIHRPSGRCPQPHPLAAGNPHSSHPHGCYSAVRTKERHTEAKNDAIERRGSTGILLPALNRLLVPSSHRLRNGLPGRNIRCTRNSLDKQTPLEVRPS